MRQMMPSYTRSLLPCLSMGVFLSSGWGNVDVVTRGFRISQAIIWWSESNRVPRSSQFVNTDQIYMLAGDAHTIENWYSREEQTAVDSHYSRARLRRIATVALALTCRTS
ncbi:hypothetical protein PILCRDRAFT_202289 [Piloderma croceum F 1598]|uniref:Uncharacterized protein n=1 Tax=Piloderma croceum (strain F 1598) TaxID=765440 RepID=A0A0C3BTR4_PILCF|nr:hypothetical protein PILCRDRAFT_202289 [Piloderma croceum F 1598]